MRVGAATHGLLAATLSAAVLGCGATDAVPDSRHTPGLSREETARLPPPPPPSTEAPTPSPQPQPDRRNPFETGPSASPDRAAATPPRAPDTAAEAPEAKERDLGAELKSLLGQPLDCLDPQKVVDLGGNLKVRVSAYVVPSGRITRATVTAPGQPASAVVCLERRVIALKLPDPIDAAPRAVETELSFDIVRTPSPPP